MDTTKLENFCKEHSIELVPIKESIIRALHRRYSTVYYNEK